MYKGRDGRGGVYFRETYQMKARSLVLTRGTPPSGETTSIDSEALLMSSDSVTRIGPEESGTRGAGLSPLPSVLSGTSHGFPERERRPVVCIEIASVSEWFRAAFLETAGREAVVATRTILQETNRLSSGVPNGEDGPDLAHSPSRTRSTAGRSLPVCSTREKRESPSDLTAF